MAEGVTGLPFCTGATVAAQVGIVLLLAWPCEHWWICCLLLLLRVVREWRLRAHLRPVELLQVVNTVPFEALILRTIRVELLLVSPVDWLSCSLLTKSPYFPVSFVTRIGEELG